jgi:hypothetical protein
VTEAGDDENMTDPDPELDALEARLSAALREDPVPPGAVEAARAAWTWRVVDAELAELLAEEAVLVRSSATAGPVAYAVGDVVVDVERAAGAGGASVVVGLVTGADPSAVDIEILDNAASRLVPAALDAAGSFRAEVPSDRPARVVVTLSDDRRIVTPWLPS